MMTDNIKIIEAAKTYAAQVTQSQKAKGFTATHLHIYTDKEGSFLYAKLRLKNIDTGDKYIRSISQDNAGKWQMKEPDFNIVYPEGGGKKPIYKRHDLQAGTDAVVYIFEGEQKADLASKLGFIATTSGGSTQIDKYHWQPLAGHTAYLWADNDSAGAGWLEQLYNTLKALSCDVRVIDSDKLGLPEKGDIVDWVAMQRQVKPDIINEELAEAIKKLPILADEQLVFLSDNIAEPSSLILPQDGEQVTPELAQIIIEQLAALPELEYQLKRSISAKALNNMSVGTLDKLVKQVRCELEAETTKSLVIDTEPYQTPVNGAMVADEIYKLVTRHIACTDAVAIASTLWIIFTWVIEASHIAPIAWINAPEKRCGKSQLLTLIALMSKRSLPSSNITAAALFRCIEKYKPTLIIDEVDTFVNDNEDLRGVLNAGHSRDNPYIIRCAGDDNEPKEFYVYGAKALSGIGKIPSTLMDRSISLTLRRKLSNEHRDRVRDLSRDTTNTIKAKLARWSDDNLQVVKDATPLLPKAINDRMQDNWEILLKVAAILGDEWLQHANSACIEISGIEHDEPSLNEQLLIDIKVIFELKKVTRIFSDDLITALCADPEMNWSTYNRGKPITQKQVSNRLGEYNISPKQMRTANGNRRGYDIAYFQDTFKRYLSAISSQSVTALQVNDSKGYSEKVSVTTQSNVTLKKPLQALVGKACNGVTHRDPQHGAANENSSQSANKVRGVI
ncbi:DUF3631 domain-containing protein [Psychrobacter alimentarius]|uniref:DNA primase n=2 Tax=Psychrobacter TaxID=497 RepID=A0ABM5ZWT9_9GAMM|nr:DUF3631 domain-containing protein [Psychrobacter alimentarius]AMT96570.1 DNA primase [Psychrobacter alimentarius]QCB31044.1 DUF3631 domain-containing protein [Psychrobacter sp. PAMC27889]